MGVLPLEMENATLPSLDLNGSETFDIGNIDKISSRPNVRLKIKINYKNSCKSLSVLSRIDTEKEVNYFKNKGILPYVFNLIKG